MSRFDRLGRWCALAYVVVSVVTILGSVGLAPWFDATSNALSDLGATGRITRPLFNGGLIVGGVLGVAVGAWLTATRTGIGRVGGAAFVVTMVLRAGIGVFPVGTPPHTPVAVAYFLGVAVSLWLLGVGTLRSADRTDGTSRTSVTSQTNTAGGTGETSRTSGTGTGETSRTSGTGEGRADRPTADPSDAGPVTRDGGAPVRSNRVRATADRLADEGPLALAAGTLVPAVWLSWAFLWRAFAPGLAIPEILSSLGLLAYLSVLGFELRDDETAFLG